jgi:hypothetical protein
MQNAVICRKYQGIATDPHSIPIADSRSGKGIEAYKQKLIRIFNHPFDAIEARGEGWKTLKFPLNTDQIFQGWQDGDRLIGLGFGKTTHYALIDIDAGSSYHSEEGLKDIRWALETIGINETILITSSRSGGWHLYFGFSRPVQTFGLSCLLHQTMEAAGLTIAKGVLEIFPNRKGWQKDAVTVYNRHRLPLQPGQGSYLLGDDFLPYSQGIEVFLDRLDSSAIANDIDLIEELATEARSNYNPAKRQCVPIGSPFTPRNPNARKWKKSLEDAIAKGWDGPSQSNILLGQIAEYGRVFLGYECEYQLANYIATTAIACPGFIPHCRHRREINAWALRWARSAIRHRYPYGTRKGGEFKELGKGGLTNEEKHAECLGRVSDAVADFIASGREWPTTIHARRNLIARMAHCSERTLIKPDYLPLWHPAHTQDDDRDADAVAVVIEASNQDTEQDTAIQDNAGSHPNNNCVVPFPARNLPIPQDVLAPAARRQSKPPQTQTQRELQPMTEKTPPKTVPIPGDWLVEPDRPHILLRLESIDEGGEWCRCQDSRQRQRGLRGGLYALAELIPAPLAIADRGEDIGLINAGTNKPDVFEDFSPSPEEQ